MTRSRFLVVPVALCAAALWPGGTAAADGPVRFTQSFPVDEEVDCGAFTATIEGEVTERYVVFLDEDGDLLRFTKYVSAPADVWTNTTTGASIVVRGHFVQTHVPVEGTDYFAVTIRGFRYLVNEPGTGVAVQEVGRITYADPGEQLALSQAGQHDLADPDDIVPTFCAALAG